MKNNTLEKIKERYWEEVIQDVNFYDDEGNSKIEEMSGRDFNQFEALCDQYAEGLKSRWGNEAKWCLVHN